MNHVENLESRTHFAAGAPDTSFGVGGQITTPLGAPSSYVTVTAIQPNGRFIIAAGGEMVRYKANGVIDRSFGQEGIAPLTIDGQTPTIDALAIAPNGGILVTESVGSSQILTRYTTHGVLNKRFGVGGNAGMPAGVSAGQITFDSAGRIVVAADYAAPLPGGLISVDGGSALALLRFSAGGKHDKHFGSSGMVITQFNESTWTPDIHPLSNGKILAVTQDIGGLGGGNVVRFNANGTLDTSYNHTGSVAIPSFSTPITGTDGQILTETSPIIDVSSHFQADGSVVLAYSDRQEEPLRVSRFTPNGTLDTSFGNQGIATIPFTESPLGVFAQPNGGYLVVANTFRSLVSQNLSDNVGIARLTSDGALDTTFGNQGTTINDNSPAIGAQSATLDGSRVLIEPSIIAQSYVAIAAYSV